ncbi:hypothetical protein [Nocardia asteroides]|uniref:hypothetical protein n=1 Tax=Nocardia asteroides TaxID=1824 RepID=UPI001E53C64C|nr:hypothetical protein [Nocardia asteroides]UGT60211.1 hypothetical protein LTT61_23825 [Nocardia asteroides]
MFPDGGSAAAGPPFAVSGRGEEERADPGGARHQEGRDHRGGAGVRLDRGGLGHPHRGGGRGFVIRRGQRERACGGEDGEQRENEGGTTDGHGPSSESAADVAVRI